MPNLGLSEVAKIVEDEVAHEGGGYEAEEAEGECVQLGKRRILGRGGQH